MKLFTLVLFAAVLTGCASSGGDGSGDTSPQLTSRMQAIARGRTELAASYYERKQYGVALQEIAVAMRADDSYSQAYNVRALIRMALHEDDQADADFRRSLQLDSDYPETHNNYGWFLCQRGKLKESIKQFKEALKNPLYATPEMAYANMGTCLKKAGMMQEAEINLQRALVFRADMPEALYGLADWSYDSGDYAGAKTYFLRFLQASPNIILNAEQLWLGFRIERKMRDHDSEASYALQLRKRFPDSREAQLLTQGE